MNAYVSVHLYASDTIKADRETLRDVSGRVILELGEGMRVYVDEADLARIHAVTAPPEVTDYASWCERNAYEKAAQAGITAHAIAGE